MSDKPQPRVPPAPAYDRVEQCKVIMVDKTGTWTCTAFYGHIGLHSWKAPATPVVEYWECD